MIYDYHTDHKSNTNRTLPMPSLTPEEIRQSKTPLTQFIEVDYAGKQSICALFAEKEGRRAHIIRMLSAADKKELQALTVIIGTMKAAAPSTETPHFLNALLRGISVREMVLDLPLSDEPEKRLITTEQDLVNEFAPLLNSIEKSDCPIIAKKMLDNLTKKESGILIQQLERTQSLIPTHIFPLLDALKTAFAKSLPRFGLGANNERRQRIKELEQDDTLGTNSTFAP
jgi:hypothetical protein